MKKNILFLIALFFLTGLQQAVCCSTTTPATLNLSYGTISCTGSEYQVNQNRTWYVTNSNTMTRLKYNIDVSSGDVVLIYNATFNGGVFEVSSSPIGQFSGFHRGTLYTEYNVSGCFAVIFLPGSGNGNTHPGIEIEFAPAANPGASSTSSMVLVVPEMLAVGTGYENPMPIAPLHILEKPETSSGISYGRLTRFQGRSLSVSGARSIYMDDFFGKESGCPVYTRGISFSSATTPTTLSSWIKQNPEAKSVSFGNNEQTLLEVKELPEETVGSKAEVSLGKTNSTLTGYGTKLTFSGIYENYRPFYIARYNNSSTSADLRVNLGNGSTTETQRFVIGRTLNDTWYPQFTVTSLGKVGIGVANPQNALEVNGTVRAKNVIIETIGSWADFVFAPGYKLRPLDEVEAHIQEQGHLPEIPSAAEVAENGISVAEINAKLLQKIEELTLYIIEQNKQMLEQNKQILDQNKRLDQQTEKMAVMEKQISVLQQNK